MTWHKHSDSLSWSDGHQGKGYLLYDGTVKTWNVDPFQPVDQRAIWEQNQEQSPIALSFEIDPDGGVVTKEPTPKVDTIVNLDQRLYNAGQRPTWEDDWDLGKFQPKPQKKDQPDYNFINSSWHFSDYQGWTNWESWHTALMMDNEYEVYEKTRQMMERQCSVEQLRDYLIRTVVGPYNKQQIEDAREWNETPYEERTDHNFNDLMDKSPEAANFVMGIGDIFADEEGKNPFGPDIDDADPEIMDPEKINWQEIWDHLYDEMEGNNDYEREHERLQQQGLTFAMPGHPDETNQMLDAWLKHHGVMDQNQQTETGGSAEHHTKMQVPIEHLPMNEGHYSPETYAQWQQQGYGEPRVREWGWETLHDIQRGRANPWQTQRMQEALQGQGYPPEQIPQIMRQKWVLDPNQNNWVKTDVEPPVNPDAPGDTTLPEGWNFTSHQSPRGYHYHPFTGRPCSCKWGQPKAKWWEKTSNFASQAIRQIKNQNQKVFRDEAGQDFLKTLDETIAEHPDAEGLVPWLAAQYKTGEVAVSPAVHDPETGEVTTPARIMHYPHSDFEEELERLKLGRYDQTPPSQEIARQLEFDRWNQLPWHERYDRNGVMRINHSGELRIPPRKIAQLAMQDYHPALSQLKSYYAPTRRLLPWWAEWFNARQHPTRRGVNIMDLSVPGVMRKVQEHRAALAELEEKKEWLDTYGPGTDPENYYRYYVKHNFGPEAGKYKGWHVVKLDGGLAEGESQALGHCIGSDEQPYKHNIESGNISAYSLRDKEGYPHVSWHVNPSGEGIGHMQGRSGDPNPDYRQLISQFNEAHGLPDEETGEEALEPAYDPWVTIPVRDVQDYIAANGDERWEMADRHADNGIGEDTEINTEEDWPAIAHDYLNYHDWDQAEELHRKMGNGNWDGNEMQMALEREADMTNPEHIQALGHWNEDMYRHEVELPNTDPSDMDSYIEADANGHDPQPTDWDSIAHDYLNYGQHPQHCPYGHQQQAYDSFHGALWNQDHEDDMENAIQSNLNWEDPLHQQAVGYWNAYWPQRGVDYRTITPDEPNLMPSEEPQQQPPQGGDFQATSAYNWEGLGPMDPIKVQAENPQAEPRNEQEAVFQLIGQAMEEGDYERARWLYQFLPEEVNPMKTSHTAQEPSTDILSPAVELQEWLMDLGGEEPAAPSIHHDSPEDTIQAPSVSPSQEPPYFPPANIPKEYKQGARRQDLIDSGSIDLSQQTAVPHPELYCPQCGHQGLEHTTTQGGHYWYCPGHDYMVDQENIPMTGDPSSDSLIYQGYQDTWRPQHEVQRDTQQADALMNDLGLNDDEFANQCAECGVDLRGHLNGEAEMPDGRVICGDCADRAMQEDRHPVQAPEQGGQRENPAPVPQALQNRELNCGDCGADLQGQMFAQNPADGQVYCVGCAEQRQHVGATKTADSPITQADATNDPLGKNPAIEPNPKQDMDYLDMHQCIRCHQMHRPDEPCPDSAVTQYKRQERQWYNRDPNAIHSEPDGLTDHGTDLSKSGSWDEDDGLDETDEVQAKLDQMQVTIERLTSVMASQSTEKKPRKLVINRDPTTGKMTSIEEV